jgi:hypothetical protein
MIHFKSLTHIVYNRYLFSVNDYFLSSKNILNASINYFIQCPENINGKLNEFHTLLIDLNQPESSIWLGIYHRTKSEILSFLSNQTFEHKVQLNFTNKELNTFITLFNEFAKNKKIRKAELFRLKAYNKAGILAISYIYQDNQFLCINFYRITSQRATNLYSFTMKHLPSGFNNTHFGRAHRTLHWLDILYFKTNYVEFYDFCGWYHGLEDSVLLNINKFKEQFTSYKVIEFSGVIYTNWLLKLIKQ